MIDVHELTIELRADLTATRVSLHESVAEIERLMHKPGARLVVKKLLDEADYVLTQYGVRTGLTFTVYEAKLQALRTQLGWAPRTNRGG